jgi:hypothetical protein
MNIKHVGLTTKWPYFEYEPSPLCGVGKNKLPIVSMDKYIDTSQHEFLHLECCKGLALTENYKTGMYPGELHISEKSKEKISFSEMLYRLTDYDPTGVHTKNLEELEKTASNPRQAIYKYIYYAMGADIPWFFALYLREQGFSKKLNKPEIMWNDTAERNFPNLISYINKLPFKEIGRVLFFTTYPGAGVSAHRDYYINSHKDQNINLFFSAGWRPSFVWDDISKEKIYLENGATSYFFNNRDYHGVDSESVFRYTLRIDGIFEDWLQEELGLEDGWVWKK